MQVRAAVRNPDLLLPGMFANVASTPARRSSYVTVPQSAITYNPYGDTVYRGRDQVQTTRAANSTAKQRFVTLGADARRPGRGLEGPEGGRTVVTGGPDQAAQRHRR